MRAYAYTHIRMRVRTHACICTQTVRTHRYAQNTHSSSQNTNENIPLNKNTKVENIEIGELQHESCMGLQLYGVLLNPGKIVYNRGLYVHFLGVFDLSQTLIGGTMPGNTSFGLCWVC